MGATLHIETGHTESGQTGPRLGRSVSIDQAAQLLQVSRRTIYNRIRDGRLVTIRTIGGSQRVLVDSLNELGASSHVMSTSPVQSYAVRVAGN
jgi:excisionase family DNA binding protein